MNHIEKGDGMRKTFFITGANRGLGYELASQAAERGHRVWCGVRLLSSEGKVQELKNRYPGAVVIEEVDVFREETIAALGERLRNEGETLDVVINNAGILLGRGQRLEELSMDEVIQSFEINTFGPMRVAKHLLPLMNEGSGSALINISSEAGSLSNAYGGDYPYAMSKTAINMFSKQVRAYVKERGIRVYALHPGWIKTDMGGELAPGDPKESARCILNVAEAKTQVDPEHFFINYNGDPMAI
jgi:NAD(P)-dependent dehydrogenase (short-subunit alcohol dehydrogenase family)